MLWSPDGNFLYTGARRDGDIICWDVRASLEPLYHMQRETRSTNQRIQFSIEPCGRHLATGAAGNVFCQLEAFRKALVRYYTDCPRSSLMLQL